jgi:hypothetical protein
MMKRCLVWILLLATSCMAQACAVCDSEIGIAVRAGIFNASFSRTILEVFTPFPVFGVAIYVVSRYLPD